MHIQPLDDLQHEQSIAMQVYYYLSKVAALRGAQRLRGISK
jgi:hypothetical protein